MSTESEFLLLIKPDSKKPSAGIINITRPVEISIHEVSPALMVNVHQNYALGFTPLGIIVDNLSQDEYYLMLEWVNQGLKRNQKFYGK